MSRVLVILAAALLLSGVSRAETHIIPPCPAQMGQHRPWEYKYATRHNYWCRYGKQNDTPIDDKAYMACFYLKPLNVCIYIEMFHPVSAFPSAGDNNAASRLMRPPQQPEIPSGFRAP